MTETIRYPIVGMKYRPPAKGILDNLQGECPLLLRPEPTNPADEFAIQVLVRSEHISPSVHEELAADLPGYGSSLEEVLAQDEWHLGYIPAKFAKELLLPPEGVGGWLGFNEEGQSRVYILAENATPRG